MFISHSDKNGVTNIDNVSRVVLNGKYITAYMIDGSNHHIGWYSDEIRARKVFNSIFEFNPFGLLSLPEE